MIPISPAKCDLELIARNLPAGGEYVFSYQDNSVDLVGVTQTFRYQTAGASGYFWQSVLTDPVYIADNIPQSDSLASEATIRLYDTLSDFELEATYTYDQHCPGS